MAYPPLRPRTLRRLQGIPLKVALVLPFVLEVATVTGLTAYLAYRSGQKTINNLATQLMLAVSDRVNLTLETYLKAPTYLVQSSARAVQFGLVSNQDLDVIRRYFGQELRALDAKHNQVNQIFFADNQGDFFTYQKIGKQEWVLHMREASTSNQLKSYLIDSAGKPSISVIKSPLPLPFPFDWLLSAPWNGTTRQPVKSGWKMGVSVSPTNQPTLTVVYIAAFRNVTKNLEGIVGADFNTSALEKYLNQLKIGNSGQAFIMASTGELIASSTEESPLVADNRYTRSNKPLSDIAIAQQQALIKRQLQATKSLDTVTRLTAQHLYDEFDGMSQVPKNQVLKIDINGKAYLAYVTPIKYTQDLDWNLVLAIPESEFSAEIEQSYYTMLWLSGAALLGAIALGLFTAHHIAKPIQRLSQASLDLMLGKLDQPVEESTRITELAVLAHTFNDMSEHLLRSFDQVKLALQESEEKFTTVFRTSPDPIVLTALPDGRFLEVNDSFLRLVGYTRDEVIHQTALEIGLWMNLEDRELFLKNVQETGRSLNQEVKTHSKTGEEIVVLLSSERVELEGQTCVLSVAKDITQRKRLEDALKLSETKFQDILNSVTTSICSFQLFDDGSQKYDYFSPSHLTLFGLSFDAMFADTKLWLSHVHPEDQNKAVGSIPPNFSDGQLMTQYRFCHPDGSIRWISDHLTFRRDRDRQCWIVTAVASDITEQKRMTDALKQRESQLRQITDALPVYIAYLDADQKYRLVNQTYEKRFGQPREWFYGKHIREVLGETGYQTIQHHLETALKGIPTAYTVEQPDQEGNIRFLEGTLVPDLDENEQVQGCHSLILDVTTRKQAEKALQLSEAQFRAAFDTAAVGMDIVSPEGRFLKVNSALCQILGYSEAELLQMTFKDLTYSEDIEQDLELERQLFSGEIPYFHFEKRFIHKDGHLVWVLLSVAIVRDENQKPLFTIAHVQDITAYKRTKAALDTQKAFNQWFLEMEASFIVTLSSNGIVVSMSHGMARSLGFVVDELIGSSYHHFVPQPDQELMEQFLKKLRGQQEPTLLKSHVITKAGKLMVVEWWGIPTLKESGDIQFVLVPTDWHLPI